MSVDDDRARQRVRDVPAHVPSELVLPFPFYSGAKTKANPHSLIAAVHDQPPVFWAPTTSIGSAWVPRRMADLRQIYMDNENFTVSGGSFFSSMTGDTWVLVPSEIDPPLHTGIRSAINPLFIPRRMAELEDRVRQYARAAIERFKDQGHCEIMNDFAFEFPIRVFIDLMGLPQSEMKRFLAWSINCSTGGPSRMLRRRRRKSRRTCAARSTNDAGIRPTISSATGSA